MDRELSLHSKLARSEANGPGVRSVVWVQGCSLGCAGCFNPETHAADGGGASETVDALVEWVTDNEVRGLTISGGEPFEQAHAVLDLGRRVRESGLDVVVLTGFTWTELVARVPEEQIRASCDVVITGRFDANRRVARGFRGSANKKIKCLSARYVPSDFDDTPVAEIVISADGTMTITGVDVPRAGGMRS